jgi:hypothetical protein
MFYLRIPKRRRAITEKFQKVPRAIALRVTAQKRKFAQG